MNDVAITLTAIIALIGWVLYIHALYRIKLLGEELDQLIQWRRKYEIQRAADILTIEELKRKLATLEATNTRFQQRMTRIDEIFDSEALKDFMKNQKSE